MNFLKVNRAAFREGRRKVRELFAMPEAERVGNRLHRSRAGVRLFITAASWILFALFHPAYTNGVTYCWLGSLVTFLAVLIWSTIALTFHDRHERIVAWIAIVLSTFAVYSDYAHNLAAAFA